MEDVVKIAIRWGELEFSGEGSEATVSKWFDRFLEGVDRGLGTSSPSGTVSTPLHRLTLAPAQRATFQHTPVPEAALRETYGRDGNGFVFLKLPGSTLTNSLLMILYGYRVLMSQPQMTGGAILGAAASSGLAVDRVDRELEKWPVFVTSSGERRAKRYALTDAGVMHIEEELTSWWQERERQWQHEMGAQALLDEQRAADDEQRAADEDEG